LSTGTAPIAAEVIGRHRQRHPDPTEDHRRQQRPEVGVHGYALVEQERESDERHPAAHQPARADPIGQPAGERRDQDDQRHHRQNCGAGLRRRVAEDVLDVERDEEEDAEHRERDEHRHDVRAGERADLEEREI
jgi:hypothetical protein